ncbi:MAG: hypothetical protein HZB23_08845 [Deltaproteobacteria bacterium]|nr:hypothetical protein [Deltaproteobacteria bacterium]
MDWTLSDIKNKIRRLTGRPDTGELIDADLKNAVNQYYRNVLPLEIPADALRGFASQAVEVGDGGSWVLSPDVISVDHPVYLVGADGLVTPVNLFTAPVTFFRLHPEDDTIPGTPEDLLIYGRTLFLRPLADAAFTLKYAVYRRPAALALDTDKPLDPAWGPLIAFGASIELLKESGESEEAASLTDLYRYHRDLCGRGKTLSTPESVRAIPRF